MSERLRAPFTRADTFDRALRVLCEAVTIVQVRALAPTLGGALPAHAHEGRRDCHGS